MKLNTNDSQVLSDVLKDANKLIDSLEFELEAKNKLIKICGEVLAEARIDLTIDDYTSDKIREYVDLTNKE